MAEDFIQSPPDSTGKHVHTKMVNDGVNDVHTPVMMIADRDIPSQRQGVDNKGAAYVRFSDGSTEFDVFGRTTVSEPNLMGMYKFYHKDYAEEFEKVEDGGALIARDATMKSVKLTCGTASGDKAEYHSHRHFHYRPGNSMTLIWTMRAGDAGKANLTRWGGWRTEDDGIYLEMVGSTIYAVVKNGNLLSEERIPTSSWNGDRLDGAGGANNLSGATADFTQTSIWWIDFQFLGAGAVRFGTYVDGEKVLCHTIGHYNALDRPYMSSAAMSFCVGQENTGITNSSSEMHVFCAVITNDGYDAVITNDGYDDFDRRPVSISREAIITSTAFVPILSFRPTALFHGVDNRARILPQIVSILADGGSVEVAATGDRQKAVQKLTQPPQR